MSFWAWLLGQLRHADDGMPLGCFGVDVDEPIPYTLAGSR